MSAPNGNGAMYVALRDSGALAQLEADGVSGLFQFSVDNALCHVADPTFLGFCHSQKAECAALTVPKLPPHAPTERSGAGVEPCIYIIIKVCESVVDRSSIGR